MLVIKPHRQRQSAPIWNSTACAVAAGLLLAASPSPVKALYDPTAPPTKVATKQSTQVYSYQVTMIVGSAKNRKAMVNEQFVGVNDTVDDAKIVAIKSDSVVLRKDGRLIETYMPGANVRR